MLEQLPRLVAHLKWADDRAFESLRAMPHPDPAAVKVLAHVLGAEEVWLARMQQRESRSAVWPDLDLDGCERLAHEVHAGLEELLDSLSEQDLDRIVAYRTSTGAAFESTMIDILFQVITHGAYHRGQIAMAVRAGGSAPLYTDWIAFVRGGVPATKADSARSRTGGK